ncbi:hypothetical protein [Clostridium sp. HBUAS56017]|uniref:hypothetical protein n=1 Tax=Clostridium sp. HBUAS56017 TaxID=2571128 RepID=UPI001178C37D|nr:hypothetical protein [Clostridium sp. HBUAS56017]
MIKLIDKYINAVRVSKLNGVVFSIIFAFLVFSTSHTYNVTYKGIPNKESFITSAVAAVILGVVWFFSSLALVKTSDRIEKRKLEEREREIAKRRAKAESRSSGKKVNNKKKKRMS